jgi:hypothetical protein
MVLSRFSCGMTLAMLGLAACTAQPPPAQPTNVGASAAQPVVPGTARIMGGTGNADIQRTTPGPGVQAPIVPGTGRIMGGTGNADIQRLGGGPPAR